MEVFCNGNACYFWRDRGHDYDERHGKRGSCGLKSIDIDWTGRCDSRLNRDKVSEIADPKNESKKD